ncbi:hypothetical protein LIER_13250 [Lithospermum erythrorhizon]|uniref:Uncharacterized protein n=1 Tax=Lithospermum erythrorhizon TaxID=34254 RepID=A0AAV3PWR5_LITER
MASSQVPQLVDFNDMLMDRPSVFTLVAITTKMKPRESLVPEAVASSPLASGTSLPTPSPLKKAKKPSEAQKKKKSQPLTRDSSDEGSRRPFAPAPIESVVNSPPVVTLDSSTTVSDQYVDRQMEMADRHFFCGKS